MFSVSFTAAFLWCDKQGPKSNAPHTHATPRLTYTNPFSHWPPPCVLSGPTLAERLVTKNTKSNSSFQDSKLVTDRYQSGLHPPGDIPFEDLSNGQPSQNHNGSQTPRGGTLRDRNQGTGSGGKSKKLGGLFGIFSGSKVCVVKIVFLKNTKNSDACDYCGAHLVFPKRRKNAGNFWNEEAKSDMVTLRKCSSRHFLTCLGWVKETKIIGLSTKSVVQQRT